jgi:hypothetical protein
MVLIVWSIFGDDPDHNTHTKNGKKSSSRLDSNHRHKTGNLHVLKGHVPAHSGQTLLKNDLLKHDHSNSKNKNSDFYADEEYGTRRDGQTDSSLTTQKHGVRGGSGHYIVDAKGRTQTQTQTKNHHDSSRGDETYGGSPSGQISKGELDSDSEQNEKETFGRDGSAKGESSDGGDFLNSLFGSVREEHKTKEIIALQRLMQKRG